VSVCRPNGATVSAIAVKRRLLSAHTGILDTAIAENEYYVRSSSFTVTGGDAARSENFVLGNFS